MISEGTLEERLDDMLRGKMRLKDVLADGEEFWAAVRLDGEEKCS
jgi:SNF2 family DNA or RNA helicase